jgi:MATE family multidrug resistance protein
MSKLFAVSPATTEQCRSILRYFIPEFIAALVLYTLVGIIDARLIAGLKSTELYATVSVTNTLTFFINKIAEGLSVGAVILCGYHQGQKNYHLVGKSAMAAICTTGGVGFVIAGLLYFQAEFVYKLLCLPDAMIVAGVPYLKVRAVGIFFMFLFLGLVGFLRGVKNTRATMYFFVLGSVIFVLLDYVLIFGHFGFPALGFQGSALAFAIQYIVMFFAALMYIMWRSDYKIYGLKLAVAPWELIRSIFTLSWPIMFDKAALQVERLWLIRLIAPMGSYALGALGVIKDMESLAFVPAVAFGQVVTLLVSNEYGAKNYPAIKKTIKIILMMAGIMVLAILAFFALNPALIIGIFDRKHAFTEFAAQAFPVVGVLVFFDLLQLILAGALRGTSNVKVVMWTRVISCILLFMPLSYAVSLLPLEGLPFDSLVMRFVVIYGSFNVVNGLTGLVYIYWFRTGRWHRTAEKI